MYQSSLKRLFDVLASSVALVILSPLMLLVAFAIRRKDGGPAFFRHRRVGKNGKNFTFLKFRSMPVNTPHVPSTEGSKLKVTRIGAFIRRTSIDELPQLLNILAGDMSVVGPRPAIPSQFELLTMRKTRGVLRCTPGLTGLAQINSYDGMPEEEKVAWDAAYCENVSFSSDMSIILRTFGYLLKPPPVY